MRDLGRCYQFASGTPGNMKKAVEWYEKALEVIDDPELEQKTMMFKMMANSDPSFAEDYPEDTGDDDFDSSELLEDDVESVDEYDDEEMDKYMTGIAPDAVTNAWKYEDELDMAGYLPDEIHGEAAWENLPRVNSKANEGDAKAISILKELDDLNQSV
ncbi:SEL1-like repeat protein [Butyrivibrio sp. WCD2001]|uniref:SEL1-like repeat protein n=1 Tax=Butyrivibrio sp. WCD2001 TaxID=1280681 RepID=UPI00041ACEBF|nr:SEL1-like repeat protein [Butyrivibrio sp. WCD2001]